MVVLHEIWGLTGHTKDVCKRLGRLGFAAVAPDLFRGHASALTPDNLREAMGVVWNLDLKERWDRTKLEESFVRKKPSREVMEAVNTLYDRSFRQGILEVVAESLSESESRFGRVSAMGFSFGGGVAFRAAARMPDLKSVVSYYGDPPDGNDLRSINSPMLAIYAGEDRFMNTRISEFTEAAAKARKDLTLKVIPGANHDFLDETKASYDERAATEAWGLTSRFLLKTLGSKEL